MNGKLLKWALLDTIFLLVFNAVFFLYGGVDFSPSVWVSYGFVHFSYIMLLITPLFGERTTRQVFLNATLYAISATYFVVSLLISLVVTLYPVRSLRAVLIVSIIVLGVYAATLISNIMANQHTASNLAAREIELKYVREASSELEGIMRSVSDKALRKKIERLYDLLHSSPVKSNAAVRSYETLVLNLIGALAEEINRGENNSAEAIIGKIEQNANERNRRLKFRV